MWDHCKSSVTHSLVVVKENRRTARFRNRDRKSYHVFRIDGCVVTDGPRADHLVKKDRDACVIVELKGCDVEHATKQLLATAAHDNVRPLLEGKLGFLVVCSRYPRFDTFVAKAKQKAAAKYRAGFHIVCDERELEIDRVVEIDGPY